MCSLAILLLSLGLSAGHPPGPDASWRHAALWDDGMAEFSVYSMEWKRYGHLHAGRVTTVVVKEPWDPAQDVKADHPGKDGFDVLKLNDVRDVRTGIYVYHQMASVFVRRDDGRLRKLAAMSTEACGISCAEMTKGKLQTHSYFDGQADRALPWPEDCFPEDGLPLHLRDYISGTVPARLPLFPTLMDGKYAPLAPVTYDLARSDAGRVEVPAGAFDAVTLRLSHDDRWLAFTFEKAAPHHLLRLEQSDGTRQELVKSERLAYWKLHDPGDEGWVPEELR